MPRIRAESIVAHKEQTRAEILDAAESLFVAQGYGSTSLGEIADVVGVGPDHPVRVLQEQGRPPGRSGRDPGAAGPRQHRGRPPRRGWTQRSDLRPPASLPRVRRRASPVRDDHHAGRAEVASGEAGPDVGLARHRLRRDPSVVRDRHRVREIAGDDPALVSRVTADVFVGGMDEVLRRPIPRSTWGWFSTPGCPSCAGRWRHDPGPVSGGADGLPVGSGAGYRAVRTSTGVHRWKTRRSAGRPTAP
jgi:hypothetical protein